MRLPGTFGSTCSKTGFTSSLGALAGDAANVRAANGSAKRLRPMARFIVVSSGEETRRVEPFPRECCTSWWVVAFSFVERLNERILDVCAGAPGIHGPI